MRDTAASLHYREQPDNPDLSHIPGDNGLPFFGRIFYFLRDLRALALEQLTRFGPVSRLRLIGNHVLMISGPELHKQIFLDQQRNFSNEMGYANPVASFYQGGLLLRDFDEHRLQRRLMQTAFKIGALQQYVVQINPIVHTHIDRWAQAGRIVLEPNIKAAFLDVAAKVFFGVEDLATQRTQLYQAFRRIDRAMLSFVRKEIPGSSFARGKNAERFIRGWLKQTVAQRRGSDGPDMLSQLCAARQENGDYYLDDDIVAHAHFLMFAAHDTTASALMHMALYLGRDPALQERCRRQSQALGTDVLAYADLEALSELEKVFYEAQRLHPSSALVPRRTIAATELGGFAVPANTVLLLPTMVNHIDGEYWTNPYLFDPERFSPERAEHKRHSFHFHPFGGGAHKCIGMHFAVLLVKCFMHYLLLNYRFKTPDNYAPRMIWVPMPKPADGVPLLIEPLR